MKVSIWLGIFIISYVATLIVLNRFYKKQSPLRNKQKAARVKVDHADNFAFANLVSAPFGMTEKETPAASSKPLHKNPKKRPNTTTAQRKSSLEPGSVVSPTEPPPDDLLL